MRINFMKTLSNNWITESHIDFEYKKYMLLAYLQEVDNYFDKTKLYPALSDLVNHYRNVVLLKNNKQNLSDSFPERIQGMDAEHFRLFFEKITQDDALMQEIENIIDYSIPQFKHFLQEGKKIYDFVEGKLYIYPVGVVPLYPYEGYMLLQNGDVKETKVYEYQITIFESSEETYRGIHTHFLISYPKNLSYTVESIKTDLIKHHTKLPNPATYLVETEITVPLEETLVPIAKRTLMKYLASTNTGKIVN